LGTVQKAPWATWIVRIQVLPMPTGSVALDSRAIGVLSSGKGRHHRVLQGRMRELPFP
jgi:hypothetical protein